MRISPGIGETSSVSPIEVALTRTFVCASSDSMIDSCQGIALSSMCAALRPKWLHQPLRAMEVAVEDDDAQEAGADQAVDDGPRAAAGPEHDRLARHLLAPDELVQRGLEARHVRVVADEPPALAGERVDRAGGLRLLGQPVDERHDPLLVRDRDVHPEEVVAADLARSRRAARSAPRSHSS